MTAHGYDSFNSVRKQYTDYERNDESGLELYRRDIITLVTDILEEVSIR